MGWLEVASNELTEARSDASAPGTTCRQHWTMLDLEVTRRVCAALSRKDATELAVKLRRESAATRCLPGVVR